MTGAYVTPEQAHHVRAYGDPARGDDAPAFVLTCKDGGRYTLARDGAVLQRETGMRWHGADAHHWHILGFGTRANSGRLVTLDEAADGADIGQGWVHDLDHGTHRMWGMPTGHRARTLVRVAP